MLGGASRAQKAMMLAISSGVATRRLIGLGARDPKGMQAISATLHLTVGFMIIAISIGMLLP